MILWDETCQAGRCKQAVSRRFSTTDHDACFISTTCKWNTINYCFYNLQAWLLLLFFFFHLGHVSLMSVYNMHPCLEVWWVGGYMWSGYGFPVIDLQYLECDTLIPCDLYYMSFYHYFLVSRLDSLGCGVLFRTHWSWWRVPYILDLYYDRTVLWLMTIWSAAFWTFYLFVLDDRRTVLVAFFHNILDSADTHPPLLYYSMYLAVCLKIRQDCPTHCYVSLSDTYLLHSGQVRPKQIGNGGYLNSKERQSPVFSQGNGEFYPRCVNSGRK